MTVPPAGPGPTGYPGSGPWGGSPPVAQESCAFHPDRGTALHCTRCARPACPECLTPASVGFHCRACVAQGRAAQRAPRTVTGALVGQRPMVTFVLIGVTILIFLVTALQARSGVDLNGSTLFRDGLLAPTMVAGGQYWRLVSSGFLHASVIHIGLNLVSLYILGVALERLLGRGRFLVVYLLALLGGSAAVMLFSDPLTPTIGASGAIFGLMGGLVVVFKRYRYDMRQLLLVLAINLYLSFQISGISWQAHVGGLIVGGAVTAAMVYPGPALRRKVQFGSAVAVLILVIAVVVIRDTQITLKCTEVTVTGFLCPTT